MTSTVSAQQDQEVRRKDVEFSDVVDAMTTIRERMDRRKKEFEAAQKKDREMWEKGEAWMLRHLQEHSLSNIATTTHTVFASDQLMASVGDRNALIEYIKENDQFDLLENRVSSKSVKTFLEEHEGELPPGVSIHMKRRINIRRK